MSDPNPIPTELADRLDEYKQAIGATWIADDIELAAQLLRELDADRERLERLLEVEWIGCYGNWEGEYVDFEGGGARMTREGLDSTFDAARKDQRDE